MLFYIFLIFCTTFFISFLVFLFKYIQRRRDLVYYHETLNEDPLGSGRAPCSSGRDNHRSNKIKDIFKIVVSFISAFLTFIGTLESSNIPTLQIYPNISSIGYQDEIEIESVVLPVYYTTNGLSVKKRGKKYERSLLINGEDIIDGRYKINAAYKIFGFTLPFWSSEIEYEINDSTEAIFYNLEYSTTQMSEEDLVRNITDGNCETSAYLNSSDDLYIEFSNSPDDLEKIARVYINNGNGESEDFYNEYSRPKEIKIEFSDGESETHILEDTEKEQCVEFDMIHETNYIKILVSEVYNGNAYSDVCISDIFFYK